MTDDLMRAMTRLAERGTPAGVDEMVDRIEAELAPHPDVPAWPSWVLPRTTSRRRIGAVLTLTIALAIVLVVALVWLPHDGGGRGERVSSSTLTPEHLRLGQRAVLAAPGEGPALLRAHRGFALGRRRRHQPGCHDAVRARPRVGRGPRPGQGARPGRVDRARIRVAVVGGRRSRRRDRPGRDPPRRPDDAAHRRNRRARRADPARHGRGRGVGHRPRARACSRRSIRAATPSSRRRRLATRRRSWSPVTGCG